MKNPARKRAILLNAIDAISDYVLLLEEEYGLDQDLWTRVQKINYATHTAERDMYLAIYEEEFENGGTGHGDSVSVSNVLV